MLATLILALIQQPVLIERYGLTETERERYDAIASELSEPDLPEWAGDYTGILLAPRSGFMLITPTCMGPDVATGSVHGHGDRVELTFGAAHGRTVTWWLVPWGDRRYLIPQRMLGMFCMHVNDGFEPRAPEVGYGFDMRTIGTYERPHGLPQVPERWQPLLLPSPLRTCILRVQRTRVEKRPGVDESIEVRVLLRLGKNDGVHPGLGFYLGRSGSVLGYVERVNASTCIVLAQRESKWRPLQVGEYAGTTNDAWRWR
jgi:hypothetical protein